jgi:hypothetical protein
LWGETTTLYRAVDEKELNDVLRYGDYGLSPHGGGKYFAKTEEGAVQFSQSSFNAGKRMTLTSVEVPTSWLEKRYHFYDPGGGNDSIHFDDETLIDLYEHMRLPEILDASWVKHV